MVLANHGKREREKEKKRHETAVNLHLSHLVRWMHKIKRSLILTAPVVVAAVFLYRWCRDDYMAIWLPSCCYSYSVADSCAIFFLALNRTQTIGYEWTEEKKPERLWWSCVYQSLPVSRMRESKSYAIELIKTHAFIIMIESIARLFFFLHFLFPYRSRLYDTFDIY